MNQRKPIHLEEFITPPSGQGPLLLWVAPLPLNDFATPPVMGWTPARLLVVALRNHSSAIWHHNPLWLIKKSQLFSIPILQVFILSSRYLILHTEKFFSLIYLTHTLYKSESFHNLPFTSITDLSSLTNSVPHFFCKLYTSIIMSLFCSSSVIVKFLLHTSLLVTPISCASLFTLELLTLQVFFIAPQVFTFHLFSLHIALLTHTPDQTWELPVSTIGISLFLYSLEFLHSHTI